MTRPWNVYHRHSGGFRFLRDPAPGVYLGRVQDYREGWFAWHWKNPEGEPCGPFKTREEAAQHLFQHQQKLKAEHRNQ